MGSDKVAGTSGDWVVWEGDDSKGNHGRMTLLAGAYDPVTRIDRFTRRFELTLKNGEIIKQDIPCQKHFATLEQIHGWLSNAGFSVEQEYGDYKGNPINDNTSRAIIFARKT